MHILNKIDTKFIKSLDALQSKINEHLKILEVRRQEREMKLCGVCYDRDADYQLKCVHKLCNTCGTIVSRCPFCRMAFYPESKYLSIEVDFPITDINLIFGRARPSHSDLLNVLDTLDHYMLSYSGINHFVHICSTINNMLGRFIYYREIVNGVRFYRWNINIPVNLVVYLFVRSLRDVDTLSHENIRYLERRILRLHSDMIDRLQYYNHDT